MIEDFCCEGGGKGREGEAYFAIFEEGMRICGMRSMSCGERDVQKVRNVRLYLESRVQALDVKSRLVLGSWKEG